MDRRGSTTIGVPPWTAGETSEEGRNRETGEDQGAYPGKTESVDERLARSLSGVTAGFDEHGHKGLPLIHVPFCSRNVLLTGG